METIESKDWGSSQHPIFVSTYDICNFGEPDTSVETAGRIDITGLYGKTLKGYRCCGIEAVYQWCPNGRRKGFSQELMCRFEGSEQHFNHMIRFMNNREAEYIILLLQPNNSYLVIGSRACDIEIASRSFDHHTFAMECDYSCFPRPYYDGPLNIVDCTEPELMKAIY